MHFEKMVFTSDVLPKKARETNSTRYTFVDHATKTLVILNESLGFLVLREISSLFACSQENSSSVFVVFCFVLNGADSKPSNVLLTEAAATIRMSESDQPIFILSFRKKEMYLDVSEVDIECRSHWCVCVISVYAR